MMGFKTTDEGNVMHIRLVDLWRMLGSIHHHLAGPEYDDVCKDYRDAEPE